MNNTDMVIDWLVLSKGMSLGFLNLTDVPALGNTTAEIVTVIQANPTGNTTAEILTVHQANPTGNTTAEMQTASTFLNAGWDFVDETLNGTEDIWWILEGQDYPRLWWELIPEN